MLDDLPASRRLVGTKQVIKAAETGAAIKCVIVAEDADEHVKARIIDTCSRHGVNSEIASSMTELGVMCGIDVGAACVALLE